MYNLMQQAWDVIHRLLSLTRVRLRYAVYPLSEADDIDTNNVRNIVQRVLNEMRLPLFIVKSITRSH